MAYNRIKQSLKKDLRNEQLQALVDAFRANPIEEEEEEEEENSESESENSESEYESESESESGSESENENSESESEYESESESEYESGSENSEYESESESEYESDSYSESESESDWDSSESSSSSDEDVEVTSKLTGRAKWVLQPKDIEKERQKELLRKKKEEERKARKEKSAAEGATEVKEEVIIEETYETPEKLMKCVLSLITNYSKNSKIMILLSHLIGDRMMVIQQWEKLLPYAQQLGIKYEMRVCSHLLSCYLLLTTVDNPLSMSQWDRCYSILQEMVG